MNLINNASTKFMEKEKRYEKEIIGIVARGIYGSVADSVQRRFGHGI